MNCPKCNQEMELRKREFLTDKDLAKPYFFTQWFYCKPCRYIKNLDECKILNNTSQYLKKLQDKLF